MARNLDVLAPGWYTEISDFWPGQAQSLKVKEVLLKEQTKYQDLAVFETEAWGRTMALDGAIQLTNKDEFAYHEMMAHVPMFAHPNPEHVLIVGGGDGGVLREVLKHPSVKKVDLVDIDEGVVNASKKFFPHISCGFADPRVTVTIQDCSEWIKTARSEGRKFDVVITDSSDPDGPASTLFGADFYGNVRACLNDNAVVVMQGENMYIHTSLIAGMVAFLKEVGFTQVAYSLINIPSYPSGSIGALVATNREEPVKSGGVRVVCVRVCTCLWLQ